MTVAYEASGATAVEVHRRARAELLHRLGELTEREPGISAGPSVGDDGQHLAAPDSDRRAGVALRGDVRVELVRGRREALTVDAVAVGDAARSHEQWPGLEQVARAHGRECVPAIDPHGPA